MTKPNRRTSARRLLAPLAAIVALLLLIWGVRVLGVVTRLQADLRGLQGMNPEELLGAPSQERDAAFAQAAQDLQDLRASIGPMLYVLPALGWMPRYGGDLANAPQLLDFGDNTVRTALDTLTIGRAITSQFREDHAAQVPTGVSVLDVVRSQAALIKRAQQSLKAASAAREGIDPANLSSAPRELLNRFDRWVPTWRTGLDVLSNAPSILGADRPRTYLLIAQNSDELRPTGGLVSAVALLRIDRGEITPTEFEDSFAVDNPAKTHPDAPEPLYRSMYAWQWMFRDANWSPDIPTSARQLIQLYALDRGTVADGVIAVNLQAVPTLLAALGPLDLEGESAPVNAENVTSKIQENWSSPEIAEGQPADWWSHRKDFLGNLFQAALSRLLSGKFDQTLMLRGLSTVGMRQDVWVFLQGDGDEPEILFPTDSGLTQGLGDALMLVDSNIGFNKVDSRINRRMEYSVHIEPDGTARSTAMITYTNTNKDIGAFCVHQPLYSTSYAELQQGCYWDYARLVTPAGSRLVSSTGLSDATQESSEASRSVFGGYLVLTRGETHQVDFTYDQTVVMKEGMVYSLRLEKQPGVPDIPSRVRVTWPAEWRVRSAEPVPDLRTADALEYSLALDKDQTLSVVFDQGESPVLQVIPFAALAAAIGVLAFRLNGRNSR